MQYLEKKAHRSNMRYFKKAILVFVFAVGVLVIGSSEVNAQALLGGTLVRNALAEGTKSYYYIDRITTIENGTSIVKWKPRRLEVNVSGVNLPTGTTLAVFLDSAQIGTITLSSTGSGLLRLATTLGNTVPAVADGALITVKNQSTTIRSAKITTINAADRDCSP